MSKIQLTWACIAAVGLFTSVKAQYSHSHTSDIGVSSLRIGCKYTGAMVEAAMGGKPTQYNTWHDEFELAEEYRYDACELRFVENGIFVEFSIATGRYPVFEQYRGGVRVGNFIDTLTRLGVPGMHLCRRPDGKCYFGYSENSSVVFEIDSANKISHISYRYSLFD